MTYESSLKEKDEVIEYLKNTYEDYSPVINQIRTGSNKFKIVMI
ncbi:MAG: hypothetical protein R3B55_02410 [Candidatus Paceibacterota bacterium]